MPMPADWGLNPRELVSTSFQALGSAVGGNKVPGDEGGEYKCLEKC